MRKIFIIKIILIGWLSISYEANAQVLPPDFACVKGDTLVWNGVNNTCGAFENYYIYFSEFPNGPFELLDSVFDINQTFYPHTNPSGRTYFYYLESNHDCPGIQVFQSDTLDNRSPVITDIEAVTVIGNNVQIEWLPNESPETEGYIIYRLTPTGTIPIDTVYNALTFLDVTANPSAQSETYYVLAFDPCGNTSLFANPHQTIFMEETTVECEQKIDLKWNPYLAWDLGVEKQEVWIGEEGAVPVLVEEIGGLDSTYAIENAVDGREYCVFIKAIAAGSQAVSITNQICLAPVIVNPIRELLFKNLDVQPNGDVEVTWLWNTDARLQSADMNISLQGNDVIDVAPIPFSIPLSRENQFIQSQPNGERGLLSFNIFTVDDCDTTNLSEIGKPIFLEVTPNGLTNNLTWTALEINDADVLSYDIFKVQNGNTNSLGQVDANTFEYSETLSPNDVSGSEICYFVRANSTFTFPDGREQGIRSNSNRVCLSQSAKIWMPNAFSPRGRNQTFKPVVAYGVPKTYKMLIFNRWGEVVFKSDKIEEGWNGKLGIRDAPLGVYTYFIQLVGQDDSSESFSGAVMLVR